MQAQTAVAKSGATKDDVPAEVVYQPRSGRNSGKPRFAFSVVPASHIDTQGLSLAVSSPFQVWIPFTEAVIGACLAISSPSFVLPCCFGIPLRSEIEVRDLRTPLSLFVR